MKLKRLELQGYKTFASRTIFDFDGGITAIVGPNGSGKSNIADALRWVLGEQSYGTLRGKRTTDMIFAGSQDRSRAGMAQAILTLDNSDGWLPIDYQEVVIGRRAYRSGENEYLLNGQKVRLRDVQELLATSGLGERTYTIVGQGLIDQALSLRAEERRALFEEAAGVSHYQAKRAATLRRLQETQHNLERVQDILSEIRPRLAGLKRQANRARNYEQVQRDLRHLLRIWYGYQWESRKVALRQQRQRALDAEAEWKEGRSRLSEWHEAIDSHRRQLLAQNRQLSQLQLQREQLREQREQARRRMAILSERASLLERQREEIAGDLPRLEEQHAAADDELAVALEQLGRAQDSLAVQERQLLEFSQSFRDKQEEIDRTTGELNVAEQSLGNERRRLSQAEGQLAQLREQLRERQASADHEPQIAAAAAEADRLAAASESAQQELSALTAQHRQLQDEQQTVRRSLREYRERADERVRLANQLNSEAARLEERCEMLDQMRQRDAVSREGIEVAGRLASLLEIPGDYQDAIEAALGARLATLIVPDGDSLWKLVSQNQAATLHVVAAADARPALPATRPAGEGVIGWASEVISAPGAPQPVADLLLGHILLVAERETAYAVASVLPLGAVAVAPDGFLVSAGGLVEVNPRDPERSILAREEAWRQAAAGAARQREAANAAQVELSTQQKEIDALSDRLNQLDRDERELARKVQEENQRFAQRQRDLDRARQQLHFLRQQQEAARAEQAGLRERITATETTLEAYGSSVIRLEQQITDVQLRLAALPVAEADQERRHHQQDIETARTIVAGREAVVESRRATLNQLDGQLQRYRARREQIEVEQRELDLEAAERTAGDLQARIEALDGRIEPLQTRLAEKQAAFEGLEEEAAAAQRRAHDMETYFTQARVALSQQENALEGLAERIRYDLGLVALSFDEEHGGQSPLPIGEIVEQLPVVNELPDDIEESIHNYRGQLQRMGSINAEAPEEYEQTLERHDFLTQQVGDLQQTEKRLRRVIAELDELTSRAFATTVANVDAIFGQMFTQLFGGGSAQLVLTEPDDLTISGVDIIARLPNRRQQRLGLLSGGERSLTAAALLFALLKVAPPPFSVLDEVDAMLDEANVTRFRAVLRDLSRNSQFIVITHNRGTVQAARTVYGVSMGTDSTSQVISIRPEEYLRKQ